MFGDRACDVALSEVRNSIYNFFVAHGVKSRGIRWRVHLGSYKHLSEIFYSSVSKDNFGFMNVFTVIRPGEAGPVLHDNVFQFRKVWLEG